MKRYFTPALAALGLCASIGIVACGTTSNQSATTTGAGTADTTTGSDIAATPDAAAVDTGPGGADIAPGTDAATQDTAAPKPDAVATKGCDPVCTPAQFCDLALATPKCVDIVCTLPSKWGVGGDGLIQKMSKLKVTDNMVTAKVAGVDKQVLDGCDLDDDGVPNNVLGKVGTLYKDLNKTLNDKIVDGTVVLALEPIDYKTDNSPFDFNVLIGDVDASNAKCDVTSDSANCKYTASKLSYDISKPAGNCPSKVTFPGAKINGGKLLAKASAFVINIPVVGINLKLTISKPAITADVTDGTSWKSTKGARLCGVITKDDLNAAIDAVPDDLLKSIGTKDSVKTMVGAILKPDIDGDADGVKESISVSLDFETVGGTITGITAK